MNDVKCPECGHESNWHSGGYCMHPECLPGVDTKCLRSESDILRAALAASGERRTKAERERNEARAEVERLRGEKHQHCGVCGNCLLGPDPCTCDERIAAERQRIAEWYAKEHCVMSADYRCCYGNSDRDEWCLACCNADRIASGHFAQQQEEGRDVLDER